MLISTYYAGGNVSRKKPPYVRLALSPEELKTMTGQDRVQDWMYATVRHEDGAMYSIHIQRNAQIKVTMVPARTTAAQILMNSDLYGLNPPLLRPRQVTLKMTGQKAMFAMPDEVLNPDLTLDERSNPSALSRLAPMPPSVRLKKLVDGANSVIKEIHDADQGHVSLKYENGVLSGELILSQKL